MYELVLYPNDLLATPCVEVIDFDESLHQLLGAMKEIMLQNQGVGLAGNQVGSNLRVFILQQQKDNEIIEFINPTIMEYSKEIESGLEGCLSVPGTFVPIARHRQVSIKAQKRNGEAFTAVLWGIEARIVEHEMDHLNGKDYLQLTNRQNRRAIKSQLGLK